MVNKIITVDVNGRKYILHPARKPAKIRVALPNEFRTFIQEDPEHMHLAYLLPMVDLDTNDDANAASHTKPVIERQISRQELPRLERERGKILEWIKKHHGNLLRNIGKPAKLEPFVIDNGVKNGIIRES